MTAKLSQRNVRSDLDTSNRDGFPCGKSELKVYPREPESIAVGFESCAIGYTETVYAPPPLPKCSLCSQKIRPPRGLSAGVEKPRLVESEGRASPSEPRIGGSPVAGLMPDSAQIGVAMVKSATQNRIHHIPFCSKRGAPRLME